ncbi:hypothetical protein M9Y10_027837 [Tritrichomonas musculus]|uniref:Uncharacterized protein n=1 Tax=Tritrichomonas musculus TaxID=1915356 RepID=A0ABR2H458_9EUKA
MTISADFIYDLTNNTNETLSNYDIVDSELLPKKQNNEIDTSKNNNSGSFNEEIFEDNNAEINNYSLNSKSNKKFKITIIKKNKLLFDKPKSHFFIINKIPTDNVELTREQNHHCKKYIHIYIDLTKKGMMN